MAQNRNGFVQYLKVFRWLGLVGIMLVLAGIVIVLFGKMEDSVTCRGVVAGLREYEMKSSVQSHVAKLYHVIGDQVKKGEPLLDLDDRGLQEDLIKLQGASNELESEIQVKTWNLELLRQDPLPKEYRHTEIGLAEYRERVIKSRNEMEVFRKLLKDRAVTAFDFQKRELEYVRNQTELKKLEDDLAKLKAGLAEKIIGQAQAEIELLKRRLESRKNELAWLRRHVSDYRFVAPEDGTISSIPNRIGLYVEPGQMLVTFAAEGPKKFIAYVDEKSIHKIREKQTVRIESSQYNYFEYGYFTGKVYAIDELPQAMGTRNCYAVRILVDENKLPLRLGSTGEAEIVTGRDYIFRVVGMAR